MIAGVQIINIDDPYNPTNASSITDGTRYPTLNGASISPAVIIVVDRGLLQYIVAVKPHSCTISYSDVIIESTVPFCRAT